MMMSNYDQGQKGIVSYYILHLSADSAQENTRVEKRIDGKSLEIQSLFFYYFGCVPTCCMLVHHVRSGLHSCAPENR